MVKIRDRNILPLDIRLSYNQCVEIYQQVNNYELGIIKEVEFIDNIRAINKKYENENL